MDRITKVINDMRALSAAETIQSNESLNVKTRVDAGIVKVKLRLRIREALKGKEKK